MMPMLTAPTKALIAATVIDNTTAMMSPTAVTRVRNPRFLLIFLLDISRLLINFFRNFFKQ